jgi:hypothetical protein
MTLRKYGIDRMAHVNATRAIMALTAWPVQMPRATSLPPGIWTRSWTEEHSAPKMACTR